MKSLNMTAVSIAASAWAHLVPDRTAASLRVPHTNAHELRPALPRCENWTCRLHPSQRSQRHREAHFTTPIEELSRGSEDREQSEGAGSAGTNDLSPCKAPDELTDTDGSGATPPGVREMALYGACTCWAGTSSGKLPRLSQPGMSYSTLDLGSSGPQGQRHEVLELQLHNTCVCDKPCKDPFVLSLWKHLTPRRVRAPQGHSRHLRELSAELTRMPGACDTC